MRKREGISLLYLLVRVWYRPRGLTCAAHSLTGGQVKHHREFLSPGCHAALFGSFSDFRERTSSPSSYPDKTKSSAPPGIHRKASFPAPRTKRRLSVIAWLADGSARASAWPRPARNRRRPSAWREAFPPPPAAHARRARRRSHPPIQRWWRSRGLRRRPR